MHGRRLTLLLLLIPLLLAACERREKTAASPGRAEATQAYVRYFGPAPTVKEGECFAVAGFLPRRTDPEKVTPVPLFLFARDGQEEKVVRHLIALQPDVLPAPLVNPFPPGSGIATLNRKGNTAEVALTFSGAPPQDPETVKGIAAALGHTLVQFPGIERVLITAGGSPLPRLAAEGFAPDPAGVVEPDPPRLLGVAGNWEKGAAEPEEVLILFDRPVQVGDIRLATEGGAPLRGETFQSMFDMAVILHPANPAEITAGMPVRVAWEVTDRLSRTGRGNGIFPLQRQEH